MPRRRARADGARAFRGTEVRQKMGGPEGRVGRLSIRTAVEGFVVVQTAVRCFFFLMTRTDRAAIDRRVRDETIT